MSIRSWLSVAAVCVFVSGVQAQVPRVPVTDQVALLKSGDATAQRNKRTVFVFWRIVYEGGHADLAPKYMSEGYIQHNPNMASGQGDLAAVLQEDRASAADCRPHQGAGDLHHRRPRPGDGAHGSQGAAAALNPAHIYYITWFDGFRIDEQGLIAEHWDPSEMWVDGKPPGAEFFSEWDH